MSSSRPRTAPVPDPAIAIREQGRQNRVGQRGPFGSATYVEGPNGYEVNTELSPGMMDLMDRQYGLAMTNSRPQTIDPRMQQIAGQLAQRVMARSGRGAGAGAGAMYLGGAPDRPPGG